MRLRLQSLLLCALICPLAAGQAGKPAQLTGGEAFVKALPGVVILNATYTNGKTSRALGFVTSSSGLVATDYAFVNDVKSMTATFSDGESFTVSGVVDFDDPKNIALVRIKVDGKTAEKTSTADVKVGDVVHIIDCNNGTDFRVQDGKVSNVNVSNGTKQIAVTCTSTWGDYGSPLLNSEGNVVGILNLYARDPNAPDVAVPISYVLGLDKTLATKGWDKFKSAAAATPKTTTKTSSTSSGTGNSNEQLLANLIVVYYDSILTLNEQYGINLMDGSWSVDTKSTMDAYNAKLKEYSAALEKISFNNSKEEMARKDLIHCENQLAADFTDMGTAAHEATTNKAWTTEATALENKAFKDSQALPTDGSIGKLIKDPRFQSFLPRMFLEQQNLIPDINGYKLGVKFAVLQPLTLIYVAPGSVAANLQLQSLDTIIDINGTVPKDMDEIKTLIKNAAGQTITLHVKRLGQTDMSFQATVPTDLGSPSTTSAPAPAPADNSDASNNAAESRPLDATVDKQAPTPQDVEVDYPKASDSDSALAMAIVDMNDARSTVDLLKLEGGVMYSYVNGPDPRAVAEVVTLHSLMELLSLTDQTDPAKDAASKELYKVISALSDAIDKIVDATSLAQKNNGWDSNSRDQGNAGYAEADNLPIDGSADKLLKDPEFQKALPTSFLLAMSLIPDPAGFSLGARVFISEPLYIISVTPGSVAEKLGLQNMETIETFNGVATKDMDDFKAMIKNAVGQQVTIKVQPEYGNEKVLQATVPTDLNNP